MVSAFQNQHGDLAQLFKHLSVTCPLAAVGDVLSPQILRALSDGVSELGVEGG